MKKARRVAKSDDIGVYCILHTASGKKYVGSSAESIKGRWNDHRSYLRLGRHGNILLQRAWDKYGEDAFEFIVLENCSRCICIKREQHWMNHYKVTHRRFGYNINPTAGSKLGSTHSPEAKAKIAAANRTRSPESREKQAASMRGRKHDPDTCARRGESIRRMWAEGRRVRTHSAETRAKISLAQRGKKLSAEHIEKVRLTLIGRKYSDETKAQMSRSAKIRGISAETREKINATKATIESRLKMSEVAKKRGISPETRQKMIESRRRNKTVIKE